MGRASTFKAWVRWQSGRTRGAFPAITGLITTESENRLERGFFKYYGKDEVTGIPWWLGEITRSKAFDWAAAIQPQTGTSTASNLASTGQGGKPASWLSMLSILCHFHGLFSRANAGSTDMPPPYGDVPHSPWDAHRYSSLVDECIGDFASFQVNQ